MKVKVDKPKVSNPPVPPEAAQVKGVVVEPKVNKSDKGVNNKFDTSAVVDGGEALNPSGEHAVGGADAASLGEGVEFVDEVAGADGAEFDAVGGIEAVATKLMGLINAIGAADIPRLSADELVGLHASIGESAYGATGKLLSLFQPFAESSILPRTRDGFVKQLEQLKSFAAGDSSKLGPMRAALTALQTAMGQMMNAKPLPSAQPGQVQGAGALGGVNSNTAAADEQFAAKLISLANAMNGVDVDMLETQALVQYMRQIGDVAYAADGSLHPAFGMFGTNGFLPGTKAQFDNKMSMLMGQLANSPPAADALKADLKDFQSMMSQVMQSGGSSSLPGGAGAPSGSINEKYGSPNWGKAFGGRIPSAVDVGANGLVRLKSMEEFVDEIAPALMQAHGIDASDAQGVKWAREQAEIQAAQLRPQAMQMVVQQLMALMRAYMEMLETTIRMLGR